MGWDSSVGKGSCGQAWQLCLTLEPLEFTGWRETPLPKVAFWLPHIPWQTHPLAHTRYPITIHTRQSALNAAGLLSCFHGSHFWTIYLLLFLRWGNKWLEESEGLIWDTRGRGGTFECRHMPKLSVVCVCASLAHFMDLRVKESGKGRGHPSYFTTISNRFSSPYLLFFILRGLAPTKPEGPVCLNFYPPHSLPHPV